MPATFGVNAEGLRKFQADIRKADKKAQSILLRKLKAKVTAVVVPKAQANASFSSRIPGTIKVSATQRRITVKAGGARAPHAAAFENDGKPGQFRHPVFGNREVWVSQTAHPFLTPAGQASESQLVDAVVEAIDEWVTEIGFR